MDTSWTKSSFPQELAMNLIYVASYYTDEIIDDLDYSTHSLAANNKKDTIIESLTLNDHTVSVVSPITKREASFGYYPKRRYEHPTEDVEIIVPSIVDIPLLNYIWLLIATTYILLKDTIEQETDAILFYNYLPHTGFPAAMVGMIQDVDILVEWEDGNFAGPDLPRKITDILLRNLTAPMLDGGVCVNNPLAKKLPTSNVEIIRGRPSIGLSPDTEMVDEKDPGKFTVMFAGRFDEIRGINTYLNVISEFADKDTEIAFWISGYGPKSEQVKREIQRGSYDNVSFLGTLPWDSYPRYLASADVLVNFQDPNRQISKYTFPSKLLDFMVTGNYIVSTRMSDLEDEFGKEIIFTNNSIDEIWETILEIKKNPEVYDAYRQSAREWVENEGSTQYISDQLESVLGGL